MALNHYNLKKIYFPKGVSLVESHVSEENEYLLSFYRSTDKGAIIFPPIDCMYFSEYTRA